MVARLSEKLGIPIGALRGYGAREQTRTGHLREVAACLGWRMVDGPRWKDLEEFLFARAMEHDSPKLLFRQACEYLSSSRLVRPGVVKILERVAAARERAREETWTRVAPLLGPRRQAELDEMLTVDQVPGRCASLPPPSAATGKRRRHAAPHGSGNFRGSQVDDFAGQELRRRNARGHKRRRRGRASAHFRAWHAGGRGPSAWR